MSTTPDIDIAGIIDSLDLSTLSIEKARTLPPECYVSDVFYQHEMGTLFSKSWLFMGHECEIPNVGDYIARDAADEPVILVRKSEDEIHAMSGVCRHRATPLFHRKENEKGNVKRINCPYHNWTYALDGKLIGAPFMEKTCPAKELRSETQLPPIVLENWHGLLFVNLDENPEPLAPHTGHLEEYLEPFLNEDMIVGTVLDYGIQEGNWKAWIENAMEPYHTNWVHPVDHDFLPPTNQEFPEWKESDQAMMRAAYTLGYFKEDGREGPVDYPMLFPQLKGIKTEDQANRSIFATVPPYAFIATLQDMFFTFRLVPHGPDKTEVVATFYWPKSHTAVHNYKEIVDSLGPWYSVFFEQDKEINAAVQRGLKANKTAHVRGRYSHLESSLLQFNHWYKRMCS